MSEFHRPSTHEILPVVSQDHREPHERGIGPARYFLLLTSRRGAPVVKRVPQMCGHAACKGANAASLRVLGDGWVPGRPGGLPGPAETHGRGVSPWDDANSATPLIRCLKPRCLAGWA